MLEAKQLGGPTQGATRFVESAVDVVPDQLSNDLLKVEPVAQRSPEHAIAPTDFLLSQLRPNVALSDLLAPASTPRGA